MAWWRAFINKSWWLQLAKQGIWTPSECLCTYFQFWFPGIHIILWFPIWHSIVGTTVTVHYDFLYLGKYLEEPQNISALKQNWTCVFETRMPPAATKSKYGKNLEVLHFNPAPPPGACDVSEVWITNRWTDSPSFVTVSSGQKKLWVYCHPTDPNFWPRLLRF